MAGREPIAVGRRIVVWGVTGSGKTTVARRLGRSLGLPAIELDALYWQPNWVQTPREEFREKVQAVLDASAEGWVCDGNYRSALDGLVVDQADTVVWLHLPWRVSFWRLMKRTVRRAWTKEPMWAGNVESWRQSFFSSDSILQWSIMHHRASVASSRRGIAALSPSVRVYELRNSREVEAFPGGQDPGVLAAEQRH
jgi:adenylate kinase family enzyme